METTVVVVDDQMDGDTAAEASQEIEETPPSDIIESKLKVISDLEKSLKFTHLLGVPIGMVGADCELRFYPGESLRCHRFMLAARSEVFHSLFMRNPQMDYWKIDSDGMTEVEVTAKNMVKYIYTGTIDDVPIDTVSDHLRLVAEFKLEPMGQLVQRRVIETLDTFNCIKYLNVAISNRSLLQLKEKAIKTIVDNLGSLVSLDSWEELLRSQPSLTAEILRNHFEKYK